MPALQRQKAGGLLVVGPGIEGRGRPPLDDLDFRARQLGLEPRGNALHHLVLQRAELALGTVETLGPEMVAGLGLDQLDGQPQRRPDRPQAALDQVAHAELAPDRPGVTRAALVGEAGVARDDEEVGHARKQGRQVLGQAIGEELDLTPVRKTVEWQDRQRRTAEGTDGRC